MSFYVSFDGHALQGVFVSGDYLACDPGIRENAAGSPRRGRNPIAADGSFTSVTSQTGIVDNPLATFTYTFSGHFNGSNSAGAARVSGVFRED